MKDILSPVEGLALDNPVPNTDQLCTRNGTSKTYNSKYKSDSDKIHIMEKIRSCSECGIGFKRIGFLSPEERLKKHEKTKHFVDCRECEYFFTSDAHIKWHIETVYDARCGEYCSYCNKTCPTRMAVKTEQTGEKLWKTG